jgi:hypothetical protein
MIENDVSNMTRIDVKGDVDGQRAKSRPHVLYRFGSASGSRAPSFAALQHWAGGTSYIAM